MTSKWTHLFVASNGTWPEATACLQTLERICPETAHHLCSLDIEITMTDATAWKNTPTIWMWNTAKQWNGMWTSAAPEPSAQCAFLWLRHGTTPAEASRLLQLGQPGDSAICAWQTDAGILLTARAEDLQALPPSASANGLFDERVGNLHLISDLHARSRAAQIACHPGLHALTEPPFKACAQPSLSACLIVKDGAPWIAQCLESLIGVVDEAVIVLDTATTDDTRTIVERYGGRIVERQWDGHFDRARNASLAAAHGQWALVIDDDEVLSPGAGPLLHQLINARGNAYIFLPVHSYSSEVDASVTSADMLRLAPLHPKVTFQGRIHEHLVGPAFAEHHVAKPALYHYGYLSELQSKIARNETYLAESFRENPGDPRLAWYMASTLAWKGDINGALAIVDGVSRGATPWHAQIQFLRASILVALDHHTEALSLLEQFEAAWNYPPTYVKRGEILLAQRRYPEAYQTFEAGLTAKWDPALTGQIAFSPTDLAAQCYAGMGTAALQLGDAAKAEDLMQRGIQASGQSPVARLGMADLLMPQGRLHEALGHLQAAKANANAAAMQKIALSSATIHVACGKPDQAAEALQELPSLATSHPQVLFVQGRIAELREDWPTAVDIWTKALAVSSDYVHLAHRAACLTQLRRIEAAQADLEQLLAGAQIKHPYTLVSLALLAEMAGQPREALGYLQEAYRMGVSDVDLLLRLAGLALQTGETAMAHGAAAAVLSVNPGHPAAKRLLAQYEPPATSLYM